MEFRNKLAFLLGRREVDGGLAEEMAFHIEERTDELVRAGVPMAEARRRARLEFGSVAVMAEARQHRRRHGDRDHHRANLTRTKSRLPLTVATIDSPRRATAVCDE